MADLRIVRAYLRFTQSDLARELGIDRRRVSEIENSDRPLRVQEAARVRELLARLQPQVLRGVSELLEDLDCRDVSR